jgi:hypothetical protein
MSLFFSSGRHNMSEGSYRQASLSFFSYTLTPPTNKYGGNKT